MTIPPSLQAISLDGESWRERDNFPGYWISDTGRAVSFWTFTGRAGGRKLSEKARLLKGRVIQSAYIVYSMTDACGQKQGVRAHQAVLLAFVGPCPKGMVCRHLDGNGRNNHLSNLAWGTFSQNSIDCVYHRTHPGVKLTPEEVLEIRQMRRAGFSNAFVARKFRVAASTACEANSGARWFHLKDPQVAC